MLFIVVMSNCLLGDYNKENKKLKSPLESILHQYFYWKFHQNVHIYSKTFGKTYRNVWQLGEEIINEIFCWKNKRR
jgi:hypothetical protein